jgi:hypothetical protein
VGVCLILIKNIADDYEFARRKTDREKYEQYIENIG